LQAIVSLALGANPKLHSLMIIAAYRLEDLGDTHSLPDSLKVVQKHDVPTFEIDIPNLTRTAISNMIKDTIRVNSIDDDFDLEALSELVYSKTEGNTFFATQVDSWLITLTKMLQTLYDRGDLHFNFERRKWHFKISNADTLPANVVELIVRGLQKLPKETQNVVKLAACIDLDTFTLWLLSLAHRHTIEETAKHLWPALKVGLIVPTSNAYQIPLAVDADSSMLSFMNSCESGADMERDHSSSSSVSGNSGLNIKYRKSPDIWPKILGFLHDKVQQSAIALIPDSELPNVHALIGRQILAGMTEDQLDVHLFEVCNQLNRAQHILNNDERNHLVKLNLRAGRKALKASAFEGANEYFTVARGLIGNDPWKEQRSLTLDVHLANVESLCAESLYQQGASMRKPSTNFSLGCDRDSCTADARCNGVNSLLVEKDGLSIVHGRRFKLI
jgi:osomolarity two-component system, sensor histidine kinase CHK1